MRTVTAIAPALVAVLVPVASASASQVSYNGSVLTYAAAQGESNAPIVTTNPYELLVAARRSTAG